MKSGWSLLRVRILCLSRLIGFWERKNTVYQKGSMNHPFARKNTFQPLDSCSDEQNLWEYTVLEAFGDQEPWVYSISTAFTDMIRKERVEDKEIHTHTWWERGGRGLGREKEDGESINNNDNDHVMREISSLNCVIGTIGRGIHMREIIFVALDTKNTV